MAKMTEQDRGTIRRFANGDKSARADAERIFEACASEQPQEAEMMFMSEATSPVPDLLLRAKYRQQLKSATA